MGANPIDSCAKATVRLFIDGIPAEVREGTTILEAAKGVGVIIPTLCDLPGLRRRAVCRLCVVECDGGGRLKAACATEAWEGVRVVTQSPMLHRLRKTTVAMLLSDHPDDCLACDRNLSCELQALAYRFGIKKGGFFQGGVKPSPRDDSRTIVRDLGKCVKCARCVAVCQDELGAMAISTAARSAAFHVCAPYGEALCEGPCVFCGVCATVCPVSAIRQADDTDEALDAISDPGLTPTVAFSQEFIHGLREALGLAPGSLGLEAATSLFRHLGFKRVFHRDFFESLSAIASARELEERLARGERLPVIAGCGTAWGNFLGLGYPGLAPLAAKAHGPDDIFGILGGEGPIPESARDQDGEKARKRPHTVVATTCLARKYERLMPKGADPKSYDLALTVREVAKLVKLSGLDPRKLGGQRPDHASSEGIPAEGPGEGIIALARTILSLERAGAMGRTVPDKNLVAPYLELEIPFNGKSLRFGLALGIKNARAALDKIASGESGLSYLKVMSCPGGCLEGGGQDLRMAKRLRELRSSQDQFASSIDSVPLFHEGEAFATFESLRVKNLFYRAP